MAFFGALLCAVFLVSVVTSKPIDLNDAEDSSKSSESSESISSEETATDVEPSQEPPEPALTETDMPNAIEESNPLDTTPPSVDGGPLPVALNTSALPELEDPQTSADNGALQLMPDDPSQTTPGVDISQGMPDLDAALNTDTAHILPDAHTEPQVATTYQGFPKDAIPLSFSSTTPLPVPTGTTLTAVPVCIAFQFVTREPDPPRGDNI
ncbi:uncharacterized protein LOC125011639 [Mugil cephalus]|uniref:uncharacterized protein LOC125011639 n=1 Tax=Mugil cephalus TaxID=48193 RepID=UPI001FB7E04A|nr:uncharacterized protein LOC125011639 [Mugil cephalus]